MVYSIEEGRSINRSSFSSRWVSFNCLIAIVAALHFVGPHAAPWTFGIYLCCLLLAVALGLSWVVHAALLAVLISALALAPGLRDSVGSLPVVPLLIPLLLSSALVATRISTRRTLSWMRMGSVDRGSWCLVGLVGLVSAGALIAWAGWTDNLGMADQMAEDLANIPFLALVIVGIPMFAIANAVTEEAIFRGVLQTAIAESSSRATTTIALQAAGFAAIHYEMGFPNGPIGYAMVFIYGLALGFLRMRTDGLLAPIAAHIVADLVIGYAVIVRAGD